MAAGCHNPEPDTQNDSESASQPPPVKRMRPDGETSKNMFMADLPSPAVSRQNLSFQHNRAIDLIVGGHQQILYLYGKAGTG